MPHMTKKKKKLQGDPAVHMNCSVSSLKDGSRNAPTTVGSDNAIQRLTNSITGIIFILEYSVI